MEYKSVDTKSLQWEVIFCIILDIAILSAMILIALFTKSAWSIILIIVLQKPNSKSKRRKTD